MRNKTLETVALVRGDERIVVNVGAQESAFRADGWTSEETESSGIKHVGGGWYELPNGERVKGKEEAEAALTDEK